MIVLFTSFRGHTGMCAVSKGIYICSSDGCRHIAHQRLTDVVSVPAAVGVCFHLPPQPSASSTRWIFADLGGSSVIFICISLFRVNFLLCKDSYLSRSLWGNPQKGTGPGVPLPARLPAWVHPTFTPGSTQSVFALGSQPI